MAQRLWLYNLRWDGSKRDPVEEMVEEKLLKNVYVDPEEEEPMWGYLAWDRWAERKDKNLGRLHKAKKSKLPKVWEPIAFFLNKSGAGKKAGIYGVGFLLFAQCESSKVWRVRALLDLKLQERLLAGAAPFTSFSKQWEKLYKTYNIGSLYEVPQADSSSFLPLELWDFKSRREEARHYLSSNFSNLCIENPEPELLDKSFTLSVGCAKSEESENSEVTNFSVGVRSRIVRNSELVLRLKRLHDDHCQICGDVLQIGLDEWYCEGHHLMPLGQPHHGPDKAANIIIVCPACHVKMDNAVIAIDPDNPTILLHLFGDNRELAVEELEGGLNSIVGTVLGEGGFSVHGFEI